MTPTVKNFIVNGVTKIKFSPKFIEELDNYNFDKDVIQRGYQRNQSNTI
jgi:hypothetical protein